MATRTIDNVIQGMMPNIKRQKEATYDYIQQLSKRLGTAGAMQRAAESVAPFAREAADRAGSMAMDAAREDERRRQYEENLKQRQAEIEQAQKNWEKNFELNQKQQQFANMMSTAGMTGLTPEMLMNMGYDPKALGLPEIGGRRSEIFSKFGGRNPVVNKLIGGGQGSYSLGTDTYNTYGYNYPTSGGYGGAARGYSTPSNPFRRVSAQAGQGPGLIRLS